ncbi:hypothetical protein IFM89_005413 [Coptis chinensis]|uniref:Uncharacterized protein n=1 Tax=Coptis chinensis TaxID=261450 RepID=A0A835M8R4_9MAGN|nr:hypothetical protein IFM89_005413 [Coptis chinensis]
MVVNQENNKNMKNSSSCAPSWFMCSFKCFPHFSSSSSTKTEEMFGVMEDSKTPPKRKPGGWRSMPYVLGNETFERLATIGLLANIMVYLLNEFHLDQVFATNVINIWSGTTNFAPLLGAYISDAHIGKFKTLALAVMASFMGMISLTLTAAIPGLRPPPCTKLQLQNAQCKGPTDAQLGVLYMSLGFLTIGAAGIRPCNVPFGVDQFDASTDEGRKGINSFFNWYYFTFTVVIMIAITVIVYIQDSVSWVLGLGLPTGFMLCSIILFFIGTKVYVYVPPGGSIFSGIAQVFVAAYKKRGLKLPPNDQLHHALYDPPLKGATILSKLRLTHQFSFLNKAALTVEGEVGEDGSNIDKWRLCTVQQVEEVKCLIRIIPIWAAGIISFTAMAQQGTFTVSQALKMDRHLGPKFQVPAGSLGVISMLALGVWVPFYDRVLVPWLRKYTKHEGGITLLQRMGIGMVLAILSMVVAAIFEEKRRTSAILHARPDGIAPISVFWLSPQLILMGLAEAFIIIGQIEFYYKQFPEHMKSFATSLLFCTMAGGNYVSSIVVAIVHKNTGRPDWLDNNINLGRVDYFYYLLAGMGVLNLVYYLVCASQYQYKGEAPIEGNDAPVDIELSTTKQIDN